MSAYRPVGWWAPVGRRDASGDVAHRFHSVGAYQERKASGEDSTFFKLVSREQG